MVPFHLQDISKEDLVLTQKIAPFFITDPGYNLDHPSNSGEMKGEGVPRDALFFLLIFAY